jgi:hypothetical protein
MHSVTILMFAPYCLTYLETRETYGRSVLITKHISRVTYEIRVETHVDLSVPYLLLLSYATQNWNVPTDFSDNPQGQFSWQSIQQFSKCYLRTDGRTDKVKRTRALLQLPAVNAPKIRHTNLKKLSRPPIFRKMGDNIKNSAPVADYNLSPQHYQKRGRQLRH